MGCNLPHDLELDFLHDSDALLCTTNENAPSCVCASFLLSLHHPVLSTISTKEFTHVVVRWVSRFTLVGMRKVPACMDQRPHTAPSVPRREQFPRATLWSSGIGG